MISSGRYNYHLQDIAEIKAKPLPLDPIVKMNLQRMEVEVAEFAAANPEEAKRIQDSLVP